MNHPLNQQNIQAWDHLYAQTGNPVWGSHAIHFLHEWEPALRSLGLKGKPILEAGVGEGRNLGFMLTLGGNPVHGCDASPSAISKIPAPYRENVHLHCCELSKIPLPDQSFAFIGMFDVFETLPHAREVMHELNRICAPSAHILLNIPDFSDSISSVGMEPQPDGGFLFAGKFYYRFYEEEEAVSLLESAGFRIVESRVHSWEEEPHENFRHETHHHTSRVFLIRKAT